MYRPGTLVAIYTCEVRMIKILRRLLRVSNPRRLKALEVVE